MSAVGYMAGITFLVYFLAFAQIGAAMQAQGTVPPDVFAAYDANVTTSSANTTWQRGIDRSMVAAKYSVFAFAQTAMEYGYENPGNQYDKGAKALFWVAAVIVVSALFLPAVYLLVGVYALYRYAKHKPMVLFFIYTAGLAGTMYAGIMWRPMGLELAVLLGVAWVTNIIGIVLQLLKIAGRHNGQRHTTKER